VVRASRPRTFLGLSLFTEVALLVSGGYLLVEVFWRPLQAGEVSILAAGLLLALASFLLLYMILAAARR
jgi:hypothetical protein